MNLAQALANTPTSRARIEYPREGAIIDGNIEITGDAIAPGGVEYSVEYRRDGESEWVPIRNGQANISNGVLAELEMSETSGLIELRLIVGEENEARRTVLLVPSAIVELNFPEGPVVSSGGMELGLNSICPNFERTVVDFRPAGEISNWTTITELTFPTIGDLSVFWSQVGLPDGDYFVRARVFSSAGLEGNSKTELR